MTPLEHTIQLLTLYTEYKEALLTNPQYGTRPSTTAYQGYAPVPTFTGFMDWLAEVWVPAHTPPVEGA